MRKNSRAYKIFEAGLETAELTGASSLTVNDLRSIAAMIAHATTPKKAKEKKKLLYNEKDVLAVLNYDLEVTRYGSLNRQLGTLALKETDLEQFRTWFSEVMYPWLHSKDIELTFSMLTRKYPEWLEKARQYRGNGAVTTASEGWR